MEQLVTENDATQLDQTKLKVSFFNFSLENNIQFVFSALRFSNYIFNEGP